MMNRTQTFAIVVLVVWAGFLTLRTWPIVAGESGAAQVSALCQDALERRRIAEQALSSPVQITDTDRAAFYGREANNARMEQAKALRDTAKADIARYCGETKP